MLNLLEKNGFIIRNPDSVDKRLYRIFLTKEGKEVKDKLIPIVTEYLKRSFDGLTQKDIDDLIRIHKHILKNLEPLAG